LLLAPAGWVPFGGRLTANHDRRNRYGAGTGASIMGFFVTIIHRTKGTSFIVRVILFRVPGGRPLLTGCFSFVQLAEPRAAPMESQRAR
jgi:hypothetical protein